MTLSLVPPPGCDVSTDDDIKFEAEVSEAVDAIRSPPTLVLVWDKARAEALRRRVLHVLNSQRWYEP